MTASLRIFLFGLILITSCRQEGSSSIPPLESELQDGRTLHSLARRSQVSVIFLLPPSECFSCTSMLRAWQSLAAEAPIDLAIVFLRQPSKEEERAARLARLKIEGTLKRQFASKQKSGRPNIVELLFVNGNLIGQARHGAPAASDKLRRLARQHSTTRELVD